MKRFVNFKVLQYSAYIALIIIAGAVVVMLYWLYAVPDQALDIKKLPIPIIKTPVRAGDYVTLHFDYCKNVSASGRVTVTLVSSKTQLVLPTQSEHIHRGCSIFDAPLPIPPQATSDTYHYHFRAVYQVNPLRQIVQEFDTARFEVIQ